MGGGRQKLSERAKARLGAAARLLRHDPQAFGLPKSWKLDDRAGYFEGVQAAIEALGGAEKAHLRGLVDWVEGYEQAEPDRTS